MRLFSPDGITLASTAPDEGFIRLWNLSDGKLLRTFKAKDLAAYSLAFSPDGQSLAAAEQSGALRIWQVSDARLVSTLEEHEAAVWGVAFSPDGQNLASGSIDESVRLWNVADGRLLKTYEITSKTAHGMVLMPDGVSLAYGSVMGSIHMVKLADGSLIDDVYFKEDTGSHGLQFSFSSAIMDVAFSPDGELFVPLGDLSNRISLYNTADGTLVRTMASYVPEVENFSALTLALTFYFPMIPCLPAGRHSSIIPLFHRVLLWRE